MAKVYANVGQHWKWYAISAAIIILFVATLIAIILFSPNDSTSNDIQVKLYGVVGVLALIATWVQIYIQTTQLKTQSDNARKQLAAEQFKNAITHLGSYEQTVILGGIYALHNLAMVDESYRRQILNILCSFIREETTKGSYKELIRLKNLKKYCHEDNGYDQEIIDQEINRIKRDKDNRTVSTIVIQTIIDLLFRRPKDREIYDNLTAEIPVEQAGKKGDYFRADLGEALLWGLDMWDAHFNGVDFYRANLAVVNCRGSEFVDARFLRANLMAVRFRQAKFSSLIKNENDKDKDETWINSHADLRGAHIRGEHFDSYIRKVKKNPSGCADWHFDTGFLYDLGKADEKEWPGVYIDHNRATEPEDVIEKVFNGYGVKSNHLDAKDVKKLAQELGYMLPDEVPEPGKGKK